MYTGNPDLVLFNGKVITMGADQNISQAVVVSGDRIQYVGTDEEAKRFIGPGTEAIDLQGRVLLPGFIESHMHPLMYAENLLGVDCGGENTVSLAKMLQALDEKVKETPKGEWIRGFGWDDSKFAEKRNPTRWDLDKVAPDNPVILTRTCVHVAVANSLALKLGNIDRNTPDPEGGHIQKDQTGEPDGILQERAMEMLPITSYTIDQMQKGMEKALKVLASYGITSIGDMGGQPEGLKIYQRLHKMNKLTARVRFWAVAMENILGQGLLDDLYELGIESGFGNDMLRIQGVKYVLDGSVSGKTAAVTKPYYKDESAYGIMYYDDEKEMTESVRKAFQGGIRVSVHAIGDRAIEFALNVIETAGKGYDLPAMRNRLEHCILPTKEQLDRIKRLGLIVGSSFGFLYPLGEGYLNALGTERVKSVIPQKTYQEMGIIAPGNTDCPVCNVNTMEALYSAVVRKSFKGSSLGEEQRVDIMEALKAYTNYPAYSTFEEDSFGSIEKGKYADLVVLQEDITTVDPETIKDIKVAMTVMGGRIVYRKD
ncbi:MAG TPA: amidohydrolase [Clostridiales bacterium]|jgi:predicted amidohydrolase YtcJ|nr:amidohydrolase [Clostridiales bacterium]